VTLRPQWLALFLAALAGGCRTTVTNSPPGLANAVVTHFEPVRAWDVVDGTRHAGSIVRFQDPDREGRAWYSVRNEHRQEVGIVDVDGRAWRYRPHEREPEWLGTGTVLASAGRILAAGPAATLVEVDVEEIAARPMR